MNERLLQYIWHYQLFNSIGLMTTASEVLRVHNPGKLNSDQGPDFLMSRISINGEEWIGNVELHVNTSDWYHHQHDKDPHYRNIILHVVWLNDLTEPSGLPLLELQSRVPVLLLEKYKSWLNNRSFISCSGSMNTIEPQVVYTFLGWLYSHRIGKKIRLISESVSLLSGDWEEAFWRFLAKSFGHKVNAEAFERIAENLPYKVLLRHTHSLIQLEALIFGQAGLLHSDNKEAYANELRNEYLFLRKKYGLSRCSFPVFFLRMRPINFPTVRLAQLAALVQHVPDLFRKIKDVSELEEIKGLFAIKASTYWDTHFRFDEPSTDQPKMIGKGLIDKLIMNCIIPFLMAYHANRGNQKMIDQVCRWASQLKSEYNSVISGYQTLGIQPRHMEDTQGLLELKSRYCDQLKCLDCSIGRFLLSEKKQDQAGQLKFT